MSTTTEHDDLAAADLDAARARLRNESTLDRARETFAEHGIEHVIDDLVDEANGQRAIDTPRRDRQLSFLTGQRGEPDFASVKISGSLPVDRDLEKQSGFRILVTTMSGEVVTQGVASCTNLAFPDKTDKHGTTTERVHTLTLE